MTKILAFVLLLAPIFAQANAIPDYKNVLSAVTLDFNNDAHFDRAVLVGNSDSSDLYLYIGGTLTLVKVDAAWQGALWGTLPSLDVSGTGTLLVNSGNDSIGRGRWTQSLEVGYSTEWNMFVVKSLKYTYRDTLDLNAGGNCVVDFEKGNATRNGQSVPLEFAKTIYLHEWSNSKLPKACQF